ncbi:putative WD repeat-containing protein [Wickerhamomyces ciferrii]|uniref:Protein SWT21 n=1 Tax=Wickerhamomyces ciferrii (strain ATCC 14091 / BCRC 22168 / CBS 111 / JCM 3599 / NBRC 0793 / NRRL Y-1031 F-60-10) TaxID=1206466 RepID=K0KTM6_WICCF|nr:putative WD repeat-containing protein [Wickerhamomyces ciferrii]CCH44734.1 putative WD repeat-containing protein [Wickerhamomyces ciferrii]
MNLRKLASTKETFNGLINDSIDKENALHASLVRENSQNGYVYPALGSPIKSRDSQPLKDHLYNVGTSFNWCDNGSTFITVSEDHGIRTYITSQTLIDDDNSQLIPYLRIFKSTPIISSALYPDSSLYSGSCSMLISQKDVPLRLQSLIPNEDNEYPIIQSYQIQDRQTEIFQKVNSMSFLDGARFITGSNKFISSFDTQRSEAIASIPSKSGIVSALTNAKSEFANDGFYSGSFSGKLTFYSNDLEPIEQTKVQNGNGITQIIESSNGKYLYVISRNSSHVEVLDIRMGLKQVAKLTGLVTLNQRITGDLLPQSQGLIIGSNDGKLLVYKDAELGMDCEPEFVTLNDCIPISSVVVNPSESQVLGLIKGDRSDEYQQVSLQKLTF